MTSKGSVGIFVGALALAAWFLKYSGLGHDAARYWRIIRM